MITSKLNTEKGAIPRPENIQSCSYDFSKIPPFTFADLYTYLIDSGEYTPENLKSWLQVIFRWSCSRLHDALCPRHELHFIQVQGVTNGEVQN